jgi:hypothetical protein
LRYDPPIIADGSLRMKSAAETLEDLIRERAYYLREASG